MVKAFEKSTIYRMKWYLPSTNEYIRSLSSTSLRYRGFSLIKSRYTSLLTITASFSSAVLKIYLSSWQTIRRPLLRRDGVHIYKLASHLSSGKLTLSLIALIGSYNNSRRKNKIKRNIINNKSWMHLIKLIISFSKRRKKIHIEEF